MIGYDRVGGGHGRAGSPAVSVPYMISAMNEEDGTTHLNIPASAFPTGYLRVPTLLLLLLSIVVPSAPHSSVLQDSVHATTTSTMYGEPLSLGNYYIKLEICKGGTAGATGSRARICVYMFPITPVIGPDRC